MADDPPAVQENSSDRQPNPSCPFCGIASAYDAISPLDATSELWDPERLTPPTYVLLSTPHVVAFLDIAPLTRGHILVAPRHHRVKIGNLSPQEASEIGRVLPLIARAVLGATFPDIAHAEADYNVVQNNGPGAAQVVPHVHFHVIPRPPLDYRPPTTSSAQSDTTRSKYGPSKIPTGLRASYVQFGRGQRHELDDDDAAVLVKDMRQRLKIEWEKEFSHEIGHAPPSQPKL